MKKILCFVSENFEDLELWYPVLRCREAGLQVNIAGKEAGKPVGTICHAGWVPASAGIVKGFRMTSTPGIKDDLIHAGAEWVDEAAVIDRNMVSARRPPDLPDYLRAFLGLFAH